MPRGPAAVKVLKKPAKSVKAKPAKSMKAKKPAKGSNMKVRKVRKVAVQKRPAVKARLKQVFWMIYFLIPVGAQDEPQKGWRKVEVIRWFWRQCFAKFCFCLGRSKLEAVGFQTSESKAVEPEGRQKLRLIVATCFEDWGI